MRESATILLLAIGSTFTLLAALGILRMPDLYTRMQTSAKSGTLGAIGMVLALAVHFNTDVTTLLAGIIVVFFFMTAPVAAHVICRAAYFIGVPLWDRTHVDELKGHYDHTTHELCSDVVEPEPAKPTPVNTTDIRGLLADEE
jgi:multicomponent Na+:H+ antiporter subunit G